MAEVKVFICDVPGCGHTYQEKIFGEGARNFGRLVGITLIDDETGREAQDPYLCPGHRAMMANYLDSLSGKPEAIDITGNTEV